ncbi:TetR/AcrR family transcriptional regulator [Xanthobacter sp. V4C-4]|uniref:TetR/AcrR family transcriptional regulator n=1 Tax=Xanthobacter cornucopiae TaxID=3119924 RepID=UPI003728F2AC
MPFNVLKAMARTIGSNGTRTAEAIRQAGVKLIYKHGYEAMSLRQLASEVGLQSGSLYKYFENKQNLLFDIVREHMEDLTSKAEADLAGITDPLTRLKTFTAFHLRYHMTRMAHVFIANMEIRSLEDEHRAVIIAQRHRYEGLLEGILRQGAEAGVFQVREPKVATYAIISMLTGICMWYRPEGRLSQDDLIAIYSGLVVGGVTGADAAHATGTPLAPSLPLPARPPLAEITVTEAVRDADAPRAARKPRAKAAPPAPAKAAATATAAAAPKPAPARARGR